MDVVQFNNDVLAVMSMANNKEEGKMKHLTKYWTEDYKKAIFSQLFGEKADFFETHILTQKQGGALEENNRGN